MNIKKLAGIILLSLIFIGLFSSIEIQDEGIVNAALIFGYAIVLACAVELSVYLILG